MSEHLLKIVREELQSQSLLQMPSQKLSNISITVLKLLSRVYELGDVGRKATHEVLKKLTSDAKFLSKVRFIKSTISGDTSPDSLDNIVLKLLQDLLKAEEALVSPIVVRYGHRVAFLFTKNCTLSGRQYRKGEMALIEPLELALAYIYECGEPLEEPFYRFYRDKLAK